MTAESDWKKARSGLPSWPDRAMETPVARENTTSPRMLVLCVQLPASRQVWGWLGTSIAPVSLSSTVSCPGSSSTVLYCCIVACTRLGGKQFVSRSRRVSAAPPLAAPPWCPASRPASPPSLPGWMVVQSRMPRLTASRVVTR